MRLILLRHGETLWNIDFRLQGHANSRLSQKGINQALAIKNTIDLLSPSKVITSDLGRAIQTSELIGHPEAIREPLLREMNMGTWTGLRKPDILKTDEDKYKNWRAGSYTPPEGENWFDFCERIRFSLQEIVMRNDCDVLTIVHSGVIRAACKVFLDLSPDFLLPVTPGTITILNFNSKEHPKLEAYNIGDFIPDKNVAD